MPLFVDLVLLGLLLLFLYRGTSRGFVKQVLDFAGLILAILLPAVFGPEISRLVVDRTGWDYRLVVCIFYSVSFLALLIGVSLLGSLLRKGIRLTILGWVDRVAGGVLGVVKIALVLSVVLLLLLQFPWGRGATREIRKSFMIPALVPLAPVTFDFIMKSMGQNKRFRSIADWERWAAGSDSPDEVY